MTSSINLSSLTASQIRNILSLVEKKEAVQAELASVESQIAALEKQKARVDTKVQGKVALKTVPVPAKPAKAAPVSESKPATTGRKGGVKDRILALLEKAGAEGIRVVDIAKALKLKEANLWVWFSVTGSKVKGLKKVAPGVYALS